MNIDRKSLLAAFLISLLFILSFPVLFPGLRLTFFAPFLIILYYQKSYTTCLWGSLFCGVILDLLTSQMHFGMQSVNYCLTTSFLYWQKRNFFADSLSTMPLMTFFFSIISTIIHLILMYFLEKEFIISLQWAFTDLIAMPFFDATYAFLLFILPFALFGKRPRRGKDYFLKYKG